MALSLETLALARQYADSIAGADAREAIEEAVRESKLYTDEKFSHITSFVVKIVDELPSSDIDTHTIYFLKRTTPSGEADYYYEYMYIDNKWELLGSTELDLSGYWTSDQVKEYVDSQRYSLPVATKTSLGGVKIDGETIDIDSEGTISVVNDYTIETAKETAQSVVDANFTDITSGEIDNLFK